MKSILITAAIVGGAIALLLYKETSRRGPKLQGASDIEGAAEDAFYTMDKRIDNLERETERAFEDALK